MNSEKRFPILLGWFVQIRKLHLNAVAAFRIFKEVERMIWFGNKLRMHHTNQKNDNHQGKINKRNEYTMLQCTHKCYYSWKFGGKLSSHMLFGIHWHYVIFPLPKWQRNHIICYKYLYNHDNITVIWCTICTAYMFVTHHWPRLNHPNTRPREHNKSDWISLNRNSTKANYLVNPPKIIIFNDFMIHLFEQLQYLLFGLVTFRFIKNTHHTPTYVFRRIFII